MSQAPTDALSYYLLPGKPGPAFAFQALHNQAYVFWRDFWRAVLAGLGSDKPLLADDFLRPDRIAVLAKGDEVVAPVDLIAFFPDDVRPAADDHVNSLVDRFWQQRIDTNQEAASRNLRVAA